jgi:2-C-methyl-D-erythritol 4-phosphate cytidylyltransferase
MIPVAVVVVAAGAGRRFGSAKQFAALGGRPLIEWSLRAFEDHPGVGAIVLVLADEADRERYRREFPKVVDVVRGGARRQDSVTNGTARLGPARGGLVLVHDGARPLVDAGLISRVIEAAAAAGAAIPVVPPEDTVKETAGGFVVRTLDRARLGRVQTPQGFAFGLLERALAQARADGFHGTDEAALVERLGEAVAVVEGDPRNLKITTPLDLIIAEAILHENRHRV